MIKKLIGLVVVVLLIGGFAFYWLELRSKPAKQLSLNSGATATTVQDKGQSVDVAGNWTVVASSQTTAGLRINEKFIGGLAEHTAVGRTSSVTGNLTIAGTKVTTASFTANLQDLEFTDNPGGGLDVSNRKLALEHSGLELSTFPTGTFKLTSPIDLKTIPKAGTTVTAAATGDLTLHGVTKSITFKIQAEIVNGQIEVADLNPIPVKLADYGMTAPTFGPVADVSNTGSFEFELLLSKA